jgi:hypothetical protein
MKYGNLMKPFSNVCLIVKEENFQAKESQNVLKREFNEYFCEV